MRFGFRSTVKSLFDVKSWMGWRSLAQNGAWIRGMYSDLLRPVHTETVKETFEDACQRYGYTPEFLKHQQLEFQKATHVYLALLGAGCLYMFWLIYKQKILASFVMLPLNFMLFSFYFRESFWLMQIRQKRLGMTFKDWLSIVVLGNGKAY
jgi:intracellular multiplication protein IcmV